jgi:hypothetical protein
MARKGEKLKKAMRMLDDREMGDVVGGITPEMGAAKRQLERAQMDSGSSIWSYFFKGAADSIPS